MKSAERASPAWPPAAALLFVAGLAGGCAAPDSPDTPVDNVVETLHGVEIVDPYRWLEDQNSAPTRAWIVAQNAYREQVMDAAPGGGALASRLTELYGIDTISTPTLRGDRYFFTKRAANQELAVLYVRRSADAVDEVLVDPHDMSPDQSLSVQYADVSADGRLAAYRVRRGGQDEVEVRFIDVDSGEHLGDVLPRARYVNVSIAAEGTGVYYDTMTDEGPRVFLHDFGEPSGTDRLVFGRGYDAGKIISSKLSANGRYLLITVLHGAAPTRTELYFRDTWTGTQVYPIVNDIDATFFGEIAGDTLFVRSNWEAPKQRVFAADLRSPAPDRWTEIVPEGDTVIESIAAAGGRLLVQALADVQPLIRVYEPDGTLARTVEFPTLGALVTTAVDGNFVSGSWADDRAFYAVSSLAEPARIYAFSVSTGRHETWARLDAPLENRDFEIEQVIYTSKDGTQVPMFVAHRRGLELNGNNPTLLTGYGGFNISVLPSFNPFAIVWMERGGVWALPNLRGGGEFGEAWHRAGMLESKQNTFDDLIAAAEWLIDSGYTNPSKLAIRGGSNGGLLVGAAMTQRPDLFAAVVCTYPLLDMLRYHQFLIAGLWVPEYGSSVDPMQFEYLATYSPYHRVRSGEDYPAVLFVTGDGDTRVAPLHARKMTALLQAETGSSNPVLLMYDTAAGHSGGRPVSDTVAELTEELRFLLWRTAPR